MTYFSNYGPSRSIASFPGYAVSHYDTDTARTENPASIDQVARQMFTATRELVLGDLLPSHIPKYIVEDFFDENKPALLELLKNAVQQVLQSRMDGGKVTPLVRELTELKNKPGIKRIEQESIRQSVEPIIQSVSSLQLLELSGAEDAILPPAFLATLEPDREPFSFQRAGISYLNATGRALLADDQGTGKTLQTITALRMFEWQGRDPLPILVVCPKNVKLNWAREIINTAPAWKDRIAIVGNKTQEKIDTDKFGSIKLLSESELKKAKVAICNYRMLHNRNDILTEIPWNAIVIDEMHNMRYVKRQRFMALAQIVEEADPEFRFSLTGTPMIKSTLDVISTMVFLGLDEHPELADWKARFGMTISGIEDTDEMSLEEKQLLLDANTVMRSIFMVRRDKSTVLKSLPPKRRYVHCIEIDNKAEYEAAYEQFKIWLMEQFANRLRYVIALFQGLEEQDESRKQKYKSDIDFVATLVQIQPSKKQLKNLVQEYVLERVAITLRAAVLTKLGKLKQVAAKGKVAQVQKFVETYLSGDYKRKCLVFGWHKEVVKEISETFDAPLIWGGTSATKRDSIVQEFQGKVTPRVCVLNLIAGREGLTLTRAANVVFVELGWDAMTHDQAEDRAHRIDPLKQNRPEVSCHYFLGKGTIDMALANFIERKRDLTRLAVSANTDNVIVEGRINEGCGIGDDDVQDVGSFIKSLIKSEADRVGADYSLDEIMSEDAFNDIVDALHRADAEEAEALAGEEFAMYEKSIKVIDEE